MRYFVFYFLQTDVESFVTGGNIPVISENNKFPNRNVIKHHAANEMCSKPEHILITGFNEFYNQNDYDNFFAECE